jgi:hypothetical protein
LIIIGLGYKARAGKDTVADLLCEYGFARLPFAAALKEEVLQRLHGTLVEIAKLEMPDKLSILQGQDPTAIGGLLHDLVYITKPPAVRLLLQEYGSEVRRADDEAYWIKKWGHEVVRLKGKVRGVVVPDVRFPNEADTIKQASGVVLRVDRPGAGYVGGHQSETSMDAYTGWDGVIANVDTIHGLHRRTIETLRDFGVDLTTGK